jgi:hypothetical protein
VSVLRSPGAAPAEGADQPAPARATPRRRPEPAWSEAA